MIRGDLSQLGAMRGRIEGLLKIRERTAQAPTEVVAIVSKLAAAELLRRLGQSIPAIDEGARIARGELLTFAKGIPLRDARAASTRNRATFYPMTSQRDDGEGFIP